VAVVVVVVEAVVVKDFHRMDMYVVDVMDSLVIEEEDVVVVAVVMILVTWVVVMVEVERFDKH
jgi:hypothetical protein